MKNLSHYVILRPRWDWRWGWHRRPRRPIPLSPGKIKIAMEVAYPPFESRQDDTIVGFDAELAALLSQKTGLTLQLVDTKFSSLIPGLSGGRQDAVISALYITEERTRQADAIPYANTGAYIMVRSDSPVAPQTEHDLCGLTVGLQQGTSWVKKAAGVVGGRMPAAGQGAIEIKEFPTSPETLQALLRKYSGAGRYRWRGQPVYPA